MDICFSSECPAQADLLQAAVAYLPPPATAGRALLCKLRKSSTAPHKAPEFQLFVGRSLQPFPTNCRISHQSYSFHSGLSGQEAAMRPSTRPLAPPWGPSTAGDPQTARPKGDHCCLGRKRSSKLMQQTEVNFNNCINYSMISINLTTVYISINSMIIHIYDILSYSCLIVQLQGRLDHI